MKRITRKQLMKRIKRIRRIKPTCRIWGIDFIQPRPCSFYTNDYLVAMEKLRWNNPHFESALRNFGKTDNQP